MDRNYCFRRKRHSYAACDAALAASFNINIGYVVISLNTVRLLCIISLIHCILYIFILFSILLLLSFVIFINI